MGSTSKTFVGLAAAAAMMAPAVALAQDAAAARALFDRGLADMQAGRYATGCPAIADSYRLDPHPGELFTLAECEARWGKVASSVAHFQDYLGDYHQLPGDEQARQRAREKIATDQIARLTPRVPQLTLRLPPAPKGTKVIRDGTELGAASLNGPLPVDPGEHLVAVVTADGGKTEQRFSLAEGETKVVELTLPAPAPVAPADPVVPPPRPPDDRPPPSPADVGTHKGWTFAAGGLAVAGLGVGAVTGAMVLGKKPDIDAHCVDVVCDATGKQAADSAKTLALVSTISFVVFGAAAVTTIVLVLTEPRARTDASIRPILGPVAGGAFVGAEGSW